MKAQPSQDPVTMHSEELKVILPIERVELGNLPPLDLHTRDADQLAADFAADPSDLNAIHARYEPLSWSEERIRELTAAMLTVKTLLTPGRLNTNTTPKPVEAIIDQVIYENYGPEGDIEVFRDAENLAMIRNGDVDTKTLLLAALDSGHLDADGLLAIMRNIARVALEQNSTPSHGD